MRKEILALVVSLGTLVTLSAAGCAVSTGGDEATGSEGSAAIKCTLGEDCEPPPSTPPRTCTSNPPPASCPASPPNDCDHRGRVGRLTGATACGRALLALGCRGRGDDQRDLPIFSLAADANGSPHYWQAVSCPVGTCIPSACQTYPFSCRSGLDARYFGCISDTAGDPGPERTWMGIDPTGCKGTCSPLSI